MSNSNERREHAALAFEEGMENWWANNNPYDKDNSSTAYLYHSYKVGQECGREDYEDKMAKKACVNSPISV